MPKTHDSRPRLLTKGPLIVSLESLFWHRQSYPPRRIAPATPPMTETARPREIAYPFRVGHGRVFRAPFTRKALVVGYWEPQLDVILEEEEDARVVEAVAGAHIKGITATEIRYWAMARNWSWLELLVRRFPWVGRVVEAVTGSGVDTETSSGDIQPIESLDPDPRVTPWVDVPVIDLEDARAERQEQVISPWLAGLEDDSYRDGFGNSR